MRYPGPVLLVPMHVRMKVEFTYYLIDHGKDLSKKTAAAVERFSKNEEVMKELEQKYFDEWWENDRCGTMKEFVAKVVKDMGDIYG